MKKICSKINLIIIIILSVTLVLSGCGKDKNSMGFSLTGIQTSNEGSKEDHEKTIELSNHIIKEVNNLNEVEKSVVFINETSVLVGIELIGQYKEIPKEVYNNINQIVKKSYPEVTDIAITNEKICYDTIEDLLKNFISTNDLEELQKDLKEIIKKE